MARRKINVIGAFSSTPIGESFVADVRGIDYVSVACYSRDAAWDASLVITVQVSPDGDQWYTAAWVAPTTGTATSVTTFTANAIRRYVNVYDVAKVRAVVTTAGGTTTIVCNIYGEGEERPEIQTDATAGELVGYATPGGGYATFGGSTAPPSSGGGGGIPES